MSDKTASAPDLLWWQRGVVYQIYPRSFQDSNMDGVGDLTGITARLSYLHDTLGVDAVWLSPFYPSPMADFGYDVANYTDVDPIYGNLAAFDRMLAEIHRLGMKLIIDFVPNHTSVQHPWFTESRSSRTSPKRDWYIWRDAKPDGRLPNNWTSVFGGPAWQFDAATGQYYLHSFLEAQPDLNWRNPEVKAAMLDAMRFWLDRGVDGFRYDVAHFIGKDLDLRDNPINPEADKMALYKPMGDYDRTIHEYDIGDPYTHVVFREVRALLDSYSTPDQPRYSVGEIHVFDWKKWAAYYGEHNDELHMPFNFSLLGLPLEAPLIRDRVEALEAALPAGAWPNFVLSNHDEHRIASRYGRDLTRLAMMLLLTLRGTPTMYYGDEIAMTDGVIPPDREQDPWGKRVAGLGLGRDPERTPMQWDATPNAGFSPAGVQTWLPVADSYPTINVAAESVDPHSMLHLTQRLLTLRRGHPALYGGSYATVAGAPDACFVYQRQSGDQRIVIALNFSEQTQNLALAGVGSGQLLLSTYVDREGTVDFGTLTLRPHEGIIVGLA